MANVRMDPDLMDQRANEYRAEGDNINAVITKLDSLLETLNGEWEGKSCEAFTTRFTELRPSFTNMEQLVRDIATSLNNAAEAIRVADGQS